MSGHRIVRFEDQGRAIWASVDGDAVFHLVGHPFVDSFERGERIGSLAGRDLLAPTLPTKIIGVGRNYARHAAEHGVEVPSQPLLFLKPPSSVLAPGAAIICPPHSERVEHEGELALVIGRRCRNVSDENAWSHVLGITCANDVTARDLQRSDAQWTRGKGFDTFCPLGPVLVTGRDAADVVDLDVVCRVNGVERQRGRTSDMVFSPARLLSYISEVMTLEPGDVVLTGTPAGVGPLQPGDRVEVEIEGVGVLSNPVK